MVSAAFQTEMERKNDSLPKIKVEFIDPSNVVTDISLYYLNGANFEHVKERAPDIIQAGNFDIVLSNHDDKFSEFKAGSLLFGVDYHSAKIRISLGFILPDGTTEYDIQATGIIDQLNTDPIESVVIFRCRDTIQRIVDGVLHLRPSEETPVANPGNTGNGLMTKVATKAFATVNEDWTVTCTTPGGDSVALFSVVGSVTGSVGPATSGTTFSSATGGVRFTIYAGGTVWVVGDIFTFSSKQNPEWNIVNPAKIVWSILTGYNWDSDTQEIWSDFVFDLDRTKSSANVDLDYDSFVQAIADTAATNEDVKGYIPYNSRGNEFLESIIILFLGSLFTDTGGRIQLQTWAPPFGGKSFLDTFSDSEKIRTLSYTRAKDEIINSVSTAFKVSDNWQFSDDAINLDGATLTEDAVSIGKYSRLAYDLESFWFTPNGVHVESVAKRLVVRYANPPTNIDFETGLDALLASIGSYIKVTDTKSGFNEYECEVIKIGRDFDMEPKTISIRARQEEDFGLLYAFLGSSVDEGDGISPQASDWDVATDSDKQFAYLSQTGGGGPDYRMF